MKYEENRNLQIGILKYLEVKNNYPINKKKPFFFFYLFYYYFIFLFSSNSNIDRRTSRQFREESCVYGIVTLFEHYSSNT